MVFFQSVLLLGYLHAFLLSLLKNIRQQLLLQASLLLLSVIMLPLLFWPWHADFAPSLPALSIVLNLATHIGLPFFLLSSTSVILQHWNRLLDSQSKQTPYHWYAWSNTGSLVALLSYPLLLESQFTLLTQTQLWVGCYGVFAATNFAMIVHFRRCIPRNSQVPGVDAVPLHKVSTSLWLWIGLSAAGSMMLLSTTHSLTLNLSSLPFLWVLPLSLYLLSYILAFSKDSLYVRHYWLPVFVFCLFASLLMYFVGSQFNSLAQILMYGLILFVSCVICHGELARSAPPGAQLTQFYLCISLGGVIGSIMTSLVAPLMFKHLTEYPLSVFFVYLLFGLAVFCRTPPSLKSKRLLPACWLAGLCILPIIFIQLDLAYTRFDIANTRNFYGYLSVKDVTIDHTTSRRLVDGTTVHGTQALDTDNLSATGYYADDSGIALAIKFAQTQPSMHMGVIGLGAGVLASYGRPSDSIHFFELNPDVKHLAETYFDYLSQTTASVQISLGDGRISLQKLANKKFDLLVVDAFSSDAIPTHLITAEAIALYRQRIVDSGMIVLHISNSHLDLYPIIAAITKRLQISSYLFKSKAAQFQSDWVVITSNPQFARLADVKNHAVKKPVSAMQDIIWTDQFNSLLPLLKL